MKFSAGMFNKFGKVFKIKESTAVDLSGHIDADTDNSNWRFVGNRHFNIVPAASNDFLLGDQVRANVTHQLTTTYDRQSKQFTEEHKFVYQNRTFSFSSPGINVDERNRWLSFPAIEVPSDDAQVY